MGFSIEVRSRDGVAQLALFGRFDFLAHREFRSGCQSALVIPASAVEVDLGGVEYLDSSALGMLLILKDDAEAADRKVRLVNCSAAVRSILEVARFDKLLSIQ